MIYASRNKSVSFLKCFILKAIGLQGFLKCSGHIFSRFVCPETKVFAVKFRHILKVFSLLGCLKMFWAYFHYLFVRKRSCLCEI